VIRRANRESVLGLLSGFRGAEPLKKLFWTELNYDRINTPLSRKGWSDAAVATLADDPLLFAGAGEAFQVIYARLDSDRLSLSMERSAVTELLKQHPYALFVFSNRRQDQWHFLNVKLAEVQNKSSHGDATRRKLFRRITVADGAGLRTAAERLEMLDLSALGTDDDLAPLRVQARHDEAFDVEAVTKRFFNEYRQIFEDAEKSISGVPAGETRRLYTQRLFNRLMFLYFIQKKGWLSYNGSTDYLRALFSASQAANEKSFLNDRLYWLFFYGLNLEYKELSAADQKTVRERCGEPIFLNGGRRVAVCGS